MAGGDMAQVLKALQKAMRRKDDEIFGDYSASFAGGEDKQVIAAFTARGGRVLKTNPTPASLDGRIPIFLSSSLDSADTRRWHKEGVAVTSVAWVAASVEEERAVSPFDHVLRPETDGPAALGWVALEPSPSRPETHPRQPHGQGEPAQDTANGDRVDEVVKELAKTKPAQRRSHKMGEPQAPPHASPSTSAPQPPGTGSSSGAGTGTEGKQAGDEEDTGNGSGQGEAASRASTRHERRRRSYRGYPKNPDDPDDPLPKARAAAATENTTPPRLQSPSTSSAEHQGGRPKPELVWPFLPRRACASWLTETLQAPRGKRPRPSPHRGVDVSFVQLDGNPYFKMAKSDGDGLRDDAC